MADFVLVVDSQLEEIARLAEQVEEFCDSQDLPPKLCFQFNLCFDEVLTNIIQHGLGGAPGRTITVRMRTDDAAVTAEVEDDAPAFDPLQRAVPDITADLDEREIGGLGVHLLRNMMDDVSYSRVGNHNRLCFTKKR
ncbi:ATP-binding protein [Niveispirillum sp.]|uniref:ATP-binding protein n=1 Tax=Niveispirillum sp. TaxID=1917217 RepID=UPI001B54783A|nr:ATP-binding protein [Niveispirillum sp.]MBP7339470.1 ATP-binding protein [Niveispirillum sp.]